MGSGHSGGKSMAMNKKAFYFTSIAIALSIVIILSYNIYTESRSKDRMDIIEIRVDTMNNLIEDIESDVENAIFIVGFRSLLSLEDYLMDKNNPSESSKFFGTDLGITLNDAFDEVFRLGTINSEKMILMENNTFTNWTVRMKEQADKTDIILDFTITDGDVTIIQSEPWVVNVRVKIKIDVQDKKGIASWNIDKTFTKNINITGFVDPLYLVNTDGVANNTMRETIYSNWPADLSAHLANAYYREHTDAPNYLDRFENKNSGSNGIESLVVDRLKDEGITISVKSAVDHTYFGATNPPSCTVLDIADTDFLLDETGNPSNTHIGFYGTSCFP